MCVRVCNSMFVLQAIRSSTALIHLTIVSVKLATMEDLVKCFTVNTLLNLHIGKEVRIKRIKRITPFTTDLLL